MNSITIDLPVVRERSPEVNAAIERFGELAFAAVDPAMLELVRIRIAMLLGNQEQQAGRAAASPVAEEKIRNLPLWPKSPLFSDAERACLDYAEQFVIDATGMKDAQIQALSAHFTTPEIFAFAHAVYILDGYQRTQMVFGAVLQA